MVVPRGAAPAAAAAPGSRGRRRGDRGAGRPRSAWQRHGGAAREARRNRSDARRADRRAPRARGRLSLPRPAPGGGWHRREALRGALRRPAPVSHVVGRARAALADAVAGAPGTCSSARSPRAWRWRRRRRRSHWWPSPLRWRAWLPPARRGWRWSRAPWWWPGPARVRPGSPRSTPDGIACAPVSGSKRRPICSSVRAPGSSGCRSRRDWRPVPRAAPACSCGCPTAAIPRRVHRRSRTPAPSCGWRACSGARRRARATRPTSTAAGSPASWWPAMCASPDAAGVASRERSTRCAGGPNAGWGPEWPRPRRTWRAAWCSGRTRPSARRCSPTSGPRASDTCSRSAVRT